MSSITSALGINSLTNPRYDPYELERRRQASLAALQGAQSIAAPEISQGSGAGGVAMKAGAGLVTGAASGAMIGNVPGAIVGGIVGLGSGIAAGIAGGKKEEEQKKADEEARRQWEEQQKLAKSRFFDEKRQTDMAGLNSLMAQIERQRQQANLSAFRNARYQSTVAR